MSALEIIARIKELPANEQVKIAQYMAENGDSPAGNPVSVDTGSDGLPVIRARGGIITSQVVHEIESRTP